MTIDFNLIITILISVILPGIAYVGRGFMYRITKLEKKTSEQMSEQQVRVLLADKLDPVKQDLEDIKHQISKVIDKLLDK